MEEETKGYPWQKKEEEFRDKLIKHLEKEEEFNFREELVKIWNETPYMENPTRTELADKINAKFDEFIRRLKEEMVKHGRTATQGRARGLAIACVIVDKLAGSKLTKK